MTLFLSTSVVEHLGFWGHSNPNPRRPSFAFWDMGFGNPNWRFDPISESLDLGLCTLLKIDPIFFFLLLLNLQLRFWQLGLCNYLVPEFHSDKVWFLTSGFCSIFWLLNPSFKWSLWLLNPSFKWSLWLLNPFKFSYEFILH